MRKVFISPHNDDETLFGAFTIMRYRADIEVVIVYDAYVQVARGADWCTASQRRAESLLAMKYMGLATDQVKFLGLRDDKMLTIPELAEKLSDFSGCYVWAPAIEAEGHIHHNNVGLAVSRLGVKHESYLTYTKYGKSTQGIPVEPASWKDIGTKLVALSCYDSQIRLPDCRPHFLRSQEEFIA